VLKWDSQSIQFGAPSMLNIKDIQLIGNGDILNWQDVNKVITISTSSIQPNSKWAWVFKFILA
jgi:hypothetical protein